MNNKYLTMTRKGKNYIETQEMCPNCCAEVTIKTDGLDSCSQCGHKEMLPCSMCELMHEFKCDWNKETRCTAFPMK